MKTFGLAVLALAAAALADIKIGHVDSKFIFDRYGETAKAQRDLDRQMAKWEEEARARQKELVDMEERIQKQSLMLSEERRKDMEAQYLKKKSEYQQFVEQIFGREGAMHQKNQEFTDPIIQKIKKTIQDVANQEGYDMVLDRAAGAVVYWKKDNDLTQRVLDILNKESPVGAAAR